MGFENFKPIFGEPKIDRVGEGSLELHRFLFHVFSPESSHLSILVTDFHRNTWEATKSISQLEDMMDIVGIGGSLSEFIDYMNSSLKSEDVKLILKSPSDKDGVAQAKLVSQKSKGMPLISIILTKLVDSAACEAISNISLGLFNAFKEQERCLLLSKGISYEKGDASESHQEQYSKTKKLQQINGSDKGDASLLSSGLQNSPNKLAARDTPSTKGTKRVVPAHRRAKVRGVLLQDTEDDNNAMD